MANMTRLTSILLFALAVAVPVRAQEPGVDEEHCKGKDSALLSRMAGCGLYQCAKKDFDAADLVIKQGR